MATKDFFLVIIKLVGLYALINAFVLIPNHLQFMADMGDSVSIPNMIVSLALPILFYLILVFFGDRIINLFNLDKGFVEEKLNFGSLNSHEITKVALVLLACVLIINNIGWVIGYAFPVFENVFQGKANQFIQMTDFISSGVKVLLGITILSFLPFFSNMIDSKL